MFVDCRLITCHTAVYNTLSMSVLKLQREISLTYTVNDPLC